MPDVVTLRFRLRDKHAAELNRQARADARKACNARYYAKNRETVCAMNADWRTAHPDEMKAIRRADYYANKAAYQARTKVRKAHIKRATPSWADQAAIAEVYAAATEITTRTGIPHDVDHIEPLRGHDRCGLHVHWNLRPLRASENRGKHNNSRWARGLATLGAGAARERSSQLREELKPDSSVSLNQN